MTQHVGGEHNIKQNIAIENPEFGRYPHKSSTAYHEIMVFQAWLHGEAWGDENVGQTMGSP